MGEEIFVKLRNEGEKKIKCYPSLPGRIKIPKQLFSIGNENECGVLNVKK